MFGGSCCCLNIVLHRFSLDLSATSPPIVEISPQNSIAYSVVVQYVVYGLLY